MHEKVLLIDDDIDLGLLIKALLEPMGMTVVQACSGIQGIKIAYEIHPDIIILDVMMPGLDGYDVCSRLREMSNIPILMLTALGNPPDILHGFDAGADDYLRKPFNKDELLARVNALVRRARDYNKHEPSSLMQYDDGMLSIDLSTKEVSVSGRRVDLSLMEYNLLACLVRNMGKIVSRRRILNEVWGSGYVNASDELTLYIYYLRKKLQDGKHGHDYVQTQKGRGYCFEPRKR